MKHSIEELFAEAYRYYVRGGPVSDSRARRTQEYLNRIEAHNRASPGYGKWRALLRRIQARFPKEQFPDVVVENHAMYMETPTVDSSWSRAFDAWVYFRKEDGNWKRRIGFQVSFVVPYYMIYVWYDVRDPLHPDREFSFCFAPDEEPFVSAIKEEIEAMYPEHEYMPPEIGMTLVPEIDAYGHGPADKATIYDCLCSDMW